MIVLTICLPDQFGVKLNCIPLPPVGAGMESKVKVRRAKVTYSYTAENPDELNLAPGQVCSLYYCVQIVYLFGQYTILNT